MRKKFENEALLRETITRYYMTAKMAGDIGQHVAWVTSGAPVELLYAADIIPIYPENHAAMIGAQKMAPELCMAAEERGFSPDICSYARSNFGSLFTGESPIGGEPKPDFLLCCNNICGTVMKWYEHLATYLNVPMILIDTPFQHNAIDPHAARYVERQLRELVEFIETISGKPFSMERLEEVVRLAQEAARLWREILSLAQNRPSPMTCFDMFVHMAPIVCLRGTQDAVDYYRRLKSEVEKRVQDGIGAIDQETYRLVWDNLPIWYKMRWLSETYASLGASFVAATYTAAWGTMSASSGSDPMQALAEAYLGVYTNRGLSYRADTLAEMVNDYTADGLIMHSNRSCKPYSFGQLEIARIVTERTGVSTLVLESDMNDSRVWSEAQMRTRIEAFIETLAENKQQDDGRHS